VAGILFTGTVFGAIIALYYWETPMSMRLQSFEASYGVEIQFPNGTAITSYDWGDFIPGEEKSLYGQFKNVGNQPVNMTWNNTGFPSGWTITVETNFTVPNTPWPANDNWGPVLPNAGIPVFINVTETSGVDDQLESFTFKLWSGETELPLDSDGDGVPDGSDPNPTSNLDSDGDGLSDDYETVVLGTDPFNVDSDGGGESDPSEIANGRNPLDPSDDVV